MSWPEIVRTLRRCYGGKQESLSSLLGASQATISRWESGRQAPGPSFRDELIRLYNSNINTSYARTANKVLAGMAFRLDRQLRHLALDPRIQDLIHHPTGKLLGHPPWESWLPQGARRPFESACCKVLETGEPGEIRYAGPLYHYHIKLWWEPDGAKLMGEGQMIERETALDSIGRLLFHCGSVGMVKADSRRIFETNEAFLRMTGYSFEDLADGGLDWVAMTPPEFAEADRRALTELRNIGEFRPFEKEYWRKDGSRVTVVLAGTAVKSDPLIAACSIIDISASKTSASLSPQNLT